MRAAKNPLAWLGGLLVLYLGVPLAAFAVRFATSSQRGLHVPGLASSLWVSLSGATISLAVITVLGVPLAYVLARSRGRLSAVIGLVVQIPLALPPLMSGIVLIYLVGPYTFLGRLFGGRLTNSLAGVVIAMTFVSAPFLIVAARAAFLSVDQGLLDVAATLGHPGLSRFARVAVPIAGPGIRAGMLLAWLRAFGEYGAVVILAYNPTSLPIYTYNQFSGVGLPTTLAPTALAVVVAVGAVALSRLRVTRRSRAPALGAPRHPEPAATEAVGFAIDQRVGAFRVALAHRPAGGRLAILGPSGSGKSVLLRAVAGLYGEGAGAVHLGEVPFEGVAVERRRVGYVAQGFSLFPHLTVWRNLLFSPRATPGLASHWLEHLGLAGLESRYPAELSGGERQRVALAQALCSSPRALLLDEPFSALDVPIRLELRRLLRRLQLETGLSTVLVTHDPEEAAFLSDEVIVVRAGVALQSGPSRQVFSRPASPAVARLLGIANLHHGTMASASELDANGARVRVSAPGLAAGDVVLWSIRPERVALGPWPVAGIVDALDATVVDVADVGTALDYFVTLTGGVEIQARVPDPLGLMVGDRCAVVLAPEVVSVWPDDHGPAPLGEPGEERLGAARRAAQN
ncbi:MAG: ATP-binding cassette domain-containing protein [Acidobacteriota bacterium]|nr:ATP-binding cassette domain-containing protein [Acidobacteriota bacterium]